MADVRATKNGNWSDTTVWNTGALPTTADDVFSNNFTVNVDTSFQVLSLRNTSGTGITAGGSFNFNSGSISGSCTRTVDNTALVPGATNLVQITAATGLVSLTVGSVVTSPSQNSVNLILHSGNCNFTLTGVSFLPGAGNTNFCINKSSTGNLIIIGNLLGCPIITSNTNTAGLNSTAGNNTVVGNIVGSLTVNPNQGGRDSVGIIQTAGSLTITGNVTGGALISTNNAIQFSGTSLTITGSITGGTTANAITTTSAANINITGSIEAGPSTAAISSTGAHTFIWDQPIIASAGSPAIISTNINATNIFTGPFINNGNTMAVQASRMFLATGSTSWQFTSDAIGVSQSLFTADQIPTYPSSSDVRLGTVYASGSLTGTLAMPGASSVQFGVPVDNTTGSAVLTTASLAQAIWDTPRSQLTVSGSIGERLQNVSTPASIGTQISSYLL